MKTIKDLLDERILILDGAMGTFIQSMGLPSSIFNQERFTDWKTPLTGNNDVLNLTAPDVVKEIHRRYINAGADIIESNTFSANRISQKEYACEQYARDMALAGARLARQVADGCKERRIWVAGSMGPTSKTLSLASDMEHPSIRPVSFDELSAAYLEQASALMEGGADLLLLETCFDALNAKAALYAIQQLNEQRGETIPVMVSATINDRSGRTLTGQTLDAFYVSISHYPILSFGLNCSFGVVDLRPFIEHLAETIPAYISIYPNAGLPNEMGEYEELPEFTAHHLKEMAEAGLLNIAGGCCGTDDRHIRAIAESLKGIPPRKPAEKDHLLRVAGLETLTIDKQTRNFTNIGERTNVAGSRKFARLIASKNDEEAAQVARQQIESGALVIDINMDDAMLDSRSEMQRFVRYISNDPAIATAVLMIDSSDWATVLEGLKNAQGKCIVNSISLKGGEDDFLSKARELRRLGAAVVVMAFDEEGQATTYERKIAIAERAYRLLTGIGFPPQDIIFDMNVLSVGTGIAEHANYATDFIRAVAWTKQHLPYAKTSGGISNLSFAFRGNNTVREAMHSVFLYHAIRAGLDMGIVNPSMLQIYDDIEPSLLQAVEDVILNKGPKATERLIALADALKQEGEQGKTLHTAAANWREKSVEERLTYALSKGVSDFLPVDIPEALHAYNDNPVAVIEKPLMQAMAHVGQLFGEGKMFLPQVVKSAKVMKQAVELLQPYIEEREKGHENLQKPVVVTATVNGDVHDIGKNIVDIVLSCNNFDVHDLGVMVPNEKILEEVHRLKPCLIGVSGLITPSLKEMENLCRLLQKEGMQIPLIIGGATTSPVHTAVRLAPLYDYLVAYGGDASYTSVLAKRLEVSRKEAIRQIKEEQQRIRDAYNNRQQESVSYEEANHRAPHLTYDKGYPKTADLKAFELLQPAIEEIVPLIDWRMFLLFWGFRGETLPQILVNAEARNTLDAGKQWLHDAMAKQQLSLRMALRFDNAVKQGNNILLEDGCVLPMLRSQNVNGHYMSLADFFDENQQRPIGQFCIVADTKSKEFADEEEKLMNHAIRARLAEACSTWLQQTVYAHEKAIRPAFGYATCPDHSLKRIVFDRLQAEQRLGATLTKSYSIMPSTAVCGLLIAHPEAHYFPVGRISRQQLQDYCRRRGLSVEEGEHQLSKYLLGETS